MAVATTVHDNETLHDTLLHYYIITGFVKITPGLAGTLHHCWDHFGGVVPLAGPVCLGWERWALVELRGRGVHTRGVFLWVLRRSGSVSYVWPPAVLAALNTSLAWLGLLCFRLCSNEAPSPGLA